MSETRLITSTANPLIKEIKALEMRKRRKETGLFLVEGLRSIIEGIELGAYLQTLVYLSDLVGKPDIQRAREYCSGLTLEVNNLVLEKISHKENPQSVLGVFKQKFQHLSDINVERAKCWVVLEEVRDPGNLGTIMRTVDAIGADGVILIGQCCDPYSFEAVRATMGSIFSVPIVATSRDEFINWRKHWTGQVIGTTLQSSVDYREVTYQSPLLLLMGNEQAGLSEDLRQICTSCIRLPMKGRADSLNLAVATGVMLYMIERDLP